MPASAERNRHGRRGPDGNVTARLRTGSRRDALASHDTRAQPLLLQQAARQLSLELEQRYGNSKRWLINRLSLGQGVLCGLEVTASADGREVSVSPGVAIDGYGREIIVPETSRGIDVRQPTDDCGRPDGLPLRGAGTVTLYICYHECEAEPAAVLVSECGPERRCENGLVRERYRLRIGRDEPAPPGLVTPEQCARIFAQPPDNTSRRTVMSDAERSVRDPR